MGTSKAMRCVQKELGSAVRDAPGLTHTIAQFSPFNTSPQSWEHTLMLKHSVMLHGAYLNAYLQSTK